MKHFKLILFQDGKQLIRYYQYWDKIYELLKAKGYEQQFDEAYDQFYTDDGCELKVGATYKCPYFELSCIA